MSVAISLESHRLKSDALAIQNLDLGRFCFFEHLELCETFCSPSFREFEGISDLVLVIHNVSLVNTAISVKTLLGSEVESFSAGVIMVKFDLVRLQESGVYRFC